MKSLFRTMTGLGVLSVVGVAPASAFAEIVENGGFETRSFFPWIVPPSMPLGQPNPQYFQIGGIIGLGGGHTGDHFAVMSSTQLRFISQFLASESGQDYELSFWLRRSAIGTSVFWARWEGEEVMATSLFFSTTEWRQFTIPVHSSFTGSLLEFGQMSFPLEVQIDDVSVVAVPAPGAASVLVMGGAVAARRRRR